MSEKTLDDLHGVLGDIWQEIRLLRLIYQREALKVEIQKGLRSNLVVAGRSNPHDYELDKLMQRQQQVGELEDRIKALLDEAD